MADWFNSNLLQSLVICVRKNVSKKLMSKGPIFVSVSALMEVMRSETKQKRWTFLLLRFCIAKILLPLTSKQNQFSTIYRCFQVMGFGWRCFCLPRSFNLREIWWEESHNLTQHMFQTGFLTKSSTRFYSWNPDGLSLSKTFPANLRLKLEGLVGRCNDEQTWIFPVNKKWAVIGSSRWLFCVHRWFRKMIIYAMIFGHCI